MKTFLAIDIGASSGRHIVGWMENGALQTKEVYRFPNGVTEADGHLIWNIEALEKHVRTGIDEALAQFPDLVSLSIDTWGVDYVLLQGDKPVMPVYAYRDSRTEAVIPQVHAIVPFAELYSHTGIQYQPFNTIYQLYADKVAGRLDGVTDYLMIPEYLMYRLCGIKAHEYTNATTGGLVNAISGQTDMELVKALGLPEHLFGPLTQPGAVIGSYQGMQVVLCATHDTGSAVEGIPMEDNHPYLSSGTWSLLGVKTPKAITNDASRAANYSNEGGVGYNRYQKNIMGMWLINNLRKELCPDTDFGAIVDMAEASGFDAIVDANAEIFLAPASMKEAFDTELAKQGKQAANVGDYFRCACLSLADSYRVALEEMEHNTGVTYSCLTIVGGGARNRLINQKTAEFTGKQIIALPTEATALGNLMIQIKAEVSV